MRGALEQLLVHDLRESLLEKARPFTTIWFRSRSYGTGATLTYLPSRLRPRTWRADIEEVADPATLIERQIGHPADPAAEARRAHERFGYGNSLDQFQDSIARAASGEIKRSAEFMALGR